MGMGVRVNYLCLCSRFSVPSIGNNITRGFPIFLFYPMNELPHGFDSCDMHYVNPPILVDIAISELY